MTDIFSPEKRSEIMSKVKRKDTKPELILRKSLWKKGLRFRIHDKSLPGCPDISNKKRKIVIFIDGCFWHGCPVHFKTPKSNSRFWKNKIYKNIERRKNVKNLLSERGFKVVEIYECQIKSNIESILNEILELWHNNYE